VAALLSGTGPARAQDADEASTYTAPAVPIEAEAADAAQARDQAIAGGQVSAFEALLRRITDPADHGRLPQPTAAAVRDMVETYSLADERTTDTRYRAMMTVRFAGEPVRQLLRQRGIGYVASASEPVLVVPVYQASPDATALLWEDTNPWLAAWRRQESQSMLMPLEVPTGDLRDVTIVTAEEALVPVSMALDRLVTRYDRARVLVAHAVRTSPQTLTVSLNYGTPRAMARTTAREIRRQPGEGETAFLTRAAGAVADRMEGDWRSATMVQAGSAHQVTALVGLTGFQDWVAIRRTLEQSPLVRDMTVQALNRDMAQLTLTVLGSVEQVRAAVAPAGLTLDQRGGYWMIGRASGGAGAYGSQGGTAPPAASGGTGSPATQGGSATTW